MPSHSRSQRKRKKVPGTELVRGQMKTEQKGVLCWAESDWRGERTWQNDMWKIKKARRVEKRMREGRAGRKQKWQWIQWKEMGGKSKDKKIWLASELIWIHLISALAFHPIVSAPHQLCGLDQLYLSFNRLLCPLGHAVRDLLVKKDVAPTALL